MRAGWLHARGPWIAAAVGGAMALALVIPGAAEDRIVIEVSAVVPEVLTTTQGRRVTFVNRSGRLVHVDFLLGTTEGHRVFHVPGQIWAVFHRPGRHEYIVHFSTREGIALRGAVEVREDPEGPIVPSECNGLTVEGMCLAR